MPERSTKHRRTRELFITSMVSVVVQDPATMAGCARAVAAGAKNPIPVESLASELDGITLSRNRVYFGPLGDVLDQIAGNFSNMRWWISDKGLNIAVVPPAEDLPHFDSLAGDLCVKYWNEGLSKTDLSIIAKELDAKATQIEGVFS